MEQYNKILSQFDSPVNEYTKLESLISSLENEYLSILLKYYLMNNDYKAIRCATSGASLMIGPNNPDWNTLDAIYKIAFELNMINIGE